MTVILPQPSAAAWRSIYAAPRDVRFDVGRFCPIDDTGLLFEFGGLVCPTCSGWWDLRGRNGMWLLGNHTAPKSRRRYRGRVMTYLTDLAVRSLDGRTVTAEAGTPPAPSVTDSAIRTGAGQLPAGQLPGGVPVSALSELELLAHAVGVLVICPDGELC